MPRMESTWVMLVCQKVKFATMVKSMRIRLMIRVAIKDNKEGLKNNKSY